MRGNQTELGLSSPDRLEGSRRLFGVQPVVAADQPEHELEALRAALKVDPGPRPVFLGAAPPKGQVRATERFEQGEQRFGVFVVAAQTFDPQLLVVRDEYRLVL